MGYLVAVGIGLIMFWKAFVVTVWAAIAESWFAYRRRRAQKGLPLRQNNNGVYVPYDWAASVEGGVRLIGRCLMVVFAINAVVLLSLVAYMRLT